MVISIVIVCYLIILGIRNYKQNKIEKMRKGLEVGDEVITIGGIVGIVRSLDEEFVLLELEPHKEEIKIEKWSIIELKTKNNM